MSVRGSARTGWMRPALLVVEVAAAVVLLAGAGLLLRSFYKLQQVETGVSVDRVLTARFFLPRASYPVERCVALYQQMIERVSGAARRRDGGGRQRVSVCRASARTSCSPSRTGRRRRPATS